MLDVPTTTADLGQVYVEYALSALRRPLGQILVYRIKTFYVSHFT